MSGPRVTAEEEPLALVWGLRPVGELLESRPRQIERIFVVRAPGNRFGRLLRRAREIGIPVSHLERPALARKVGTEAAHQGIVARVAPLAYSRPEDLCSALLSEPASMLVLLDGVEDPRNLGAILRTCAAAGVRGVLLGTESTVGLTGTVVKASAGAIERVAVARDPQPTRRIEGLRQSGVTAVGLDLRGTQDWDRIDLLGRIIIVAGGEARGLRPGLSRVCDHQVAIPMATGVNSLNVGVALGVLLFEAVRQRRSQKTNS